MIILGKIKRKLDSNFNNFADGTKVIPAIGIQDQVKDILCQLEAFVEFFCPLRSERFKGVFNLSKETMPSQTIKKKKSTFFFEKIMDEINDQSISEDSLTCTQ